MKWNDLTKQDKLLVYMYNCNHCFNYNIDGKYLIGNRYPFAVAVNSISNLRDLGNSLLKKNLICYANEYVGRTLSLKLTEDGIFHVNHLIQSLEDNPFEVDSNTVQVQDPVEKLSLECGKLATKIIQLKEENKNLKLDLAKMLDIVDSKKEIIDNLSKSLSEVYAKLDKKNKENEYLTDILKTKLDAEKKMVAWTESIIKGNAC